MSENPRPASGRHERRFSATLSEKFDEVTSGVESLTLGACAQTTLSLQDPIPSKLVLGKILYNQQDKTRWVIREHLASGGMAHVYQANSKDSRLPPRAVKMSKDLCEPHNEQTLETAKLVSTFEHHAFPKIFSHGRFSDDRLKTRNPAYMVLEMLQDDPLTYLRKNKVLGMDEALHPNVALLLTQDLLDYAIALQDKGMANGDLHPFQTMMRMPMLQSGNELFSYCQNIDSRRFETVVADCDSIKPIGVHIPHPVFTLRYGDPWFVNIEDLEFKYTNVTDSYSIMADLFTWLTGHPLLPNDREPDDAPPAHKAVWWKDLIETRPLPNAINSNLPPLFTLEDIYRQTYPSVGVKVPTRRIAKKSLTERLKGMIRRAQEKTITTLSKDQQTIERLVDLLCMGLCSPRNRATPQELRDLISEYFPKHEEIYGLRDPATGRFVQRTRVVPQPFDSMPHYADRVQRKPPTGKHSRYRIHSREIDMRRREENGKSTIDENSPRKEYTAEELAELTPTDGYRLEDRNEDETPQSSEK